MSGYKGVESEAWVTQLPLKEHRRKDAIPRSGWGGGRILSVFEVYPYLVTESARCLGSAVCFASRLSVLTNFSDAGRERFI